MFIAKVTIVNVIKPFVIYTSRQISWSVCLLTKYNYLLERPEAYPLSEATESLQTFLTNETKLNMQIHSSLFVQSEND
jgi:hypothetical protein